MTPTGDPKQVNKSEKSVAKTQTLAGKCETWLFKISVWQNPVATVGFASKFCAEWYGRELPSSHGDYFRELFGFLRRWSVSGRSLWELSGESLGWALFLNDFHRTRPKHRAKIDKRSSQSRSKVDPKSTLRANKTKRNKTRLF